jgi:hypothetical protein
MQRTVESLHNWHQTRLGLLIFGVVELALAYVLAARAWDTGSWWEYLFAFISLVGGVQNLSKLIWKLVRHGKYKATEA